MHTKTDLGSQGSGQGFGGMVDRSFKRVLKALGSLVPPFGFALGGIFFIYNPWIGVLLWVALAQNPRYAAFALLGFGVGAAVKWLLRIGDAPDLGGGVKANAVMVAVAVAWMTGQLGLPLGVQLAIAAASAAVTAIVAAAIMRVLAGTGIPPLVSGYCIVAAMLYLACPNCTVLSANSMPPWLQPTDIGGWVEAFIRSMGSLVYTPEIKVGLIVSMAILLWSRTIFLAGTIGWISGVCTAIGFQKLNIYYYMLPASYNYFLVGMALGSVVFLPGRASLLVAALGGCVASFLALVIQLWLLGAAASYLPIAATITIWVGVSALTLAGYHSILWRNLTPHFPPEEAWWRTAYLSQRFGHPEPLEEVPAIGPAAFRHERRAFRRPDPLMMVPVVGPAQISQGFNGEVTHIGLWRHALDYQYPQADAYSVSLWGASVVAPAAGVVDRIKNDIPDNALGVCNYADNWGNYVVIHLDTGGWVLLAHLQQWSIVVASGMRVEAGAYLGKVGNSGRSLIPHLHLQLQNAPEPGVPTAPFRLANYLSAVSPKEPFLHWNSSANPGRGALVMAAPVNPVVYGLLSTITPGSAVWFVETHGHIPRAFQQSQSAKVVRINLTLDETGRYQFDSGASGALAFSLAPDAWRVDELDKVTSSFLKLLRFAAPTIPYAARDGITWDDLAPTIPAGLAGGSWLSIAPYIGWEFPVAHCKCILESGSEHGTLEIETRIEPVHSLLPTKLNCQFEYLRGPVKIQADFEGGSIVYKLLSFEPSLTKVEEST